MEKRRKVDCCGCGACASVCPKNAIAMSEDENGFSYPQINESECIQCGLCDKVCVYSSSLTVGSLRETYVVATKNTDPKMSASGGAFASFAKCILDNGGVVYGCAMCSQDTMTPKHIRIEYGYELRKLQGSKYVQSDLGTCYHDAERDLKSNRFVLFSGTPCQIAGLKGYLRKDYHNLFTIDIICHGVPSAQMFQDYLKFEEHKRKKKIIDFKFRDKSEGWKLHGKMVLEDENGKRENVYFEPEQSSYYQLFLNSYTYRENCYTCPYACDHRPGDITIGDYWCIDLVHPELLVQNGGGFDEVTGISCLIVNNEHGRNMLERYGIGLMLALSTFENAAKYNGQLSHPSVLKPERKIVMEKYAQGYAALDRWYRRKQFPITVERRIRVAIPRWIKDALNRILGRC